MNRRCMGCMEVYDDKFEVCPHCGYIYGTPPREAYHIPPGSVLKKRYIVGRVLGFGGFGVTYIGYDAVLNSKVAIKEYLPSEFSTRMPNQQMVTIYSGDSEEQFQAGLKKTLEEAKRLAKFQSEPEIVHIYDCFEANSTAYIIMEYLDGESLKDKIDRDGKMTVEEALPIVMAVLSGLKKVHKEGIIHRDIAPDNIYLLKDGGVKLLDFGAARYATTQHSKSLSVIIKPGYAPEEQYRSRGDQGPWTDVYALAATFYKMITGITPEDAMERSIKDSVKEPSKLGVNIRKSMEAALMNAMNVKIEGRTQSAEDFERELQAAEVKRVIVKNKKADLGRLPLWVKIAVPCAGAVFAGVLILILSGVIPMGDRVAEFTIAKGKTLVPDVVNQEQEEAASIITAASLRPQIVDGAFDSQVIVGRVLSQTPGSGVETDQDSIIELTVSRGAEMVQLPDLAGLSEEEAAARLNSLGVQYETEEVDSPVEAGKVAVISRADDGSSVQAGDSIERENTVIRLGISKGLGELDEEREVSVPELTGMQYEEAQEMLSDMEVYGIYLEQIGAEYSDTVPNGAIMEQDPVSGTSVHAGDTVYVKVSRGRHMIQLPAVTNTAGEEAIAALEEAGFTVRTEQEYNDIVLAGNVIRMEADGADTQEIREGKVQVSDQEQVKYGAQITLYVSLGARPQETQPPRTTAAPPVTQAPPTQAPTAPPTQAPTAPPTQAPTTQAPTQPATQPYQEDIFNQIGRQQGIIGNQ